MQTSVLKATSVRCAPSLQRTRLSTFKRAPLVVRAAAGKFLCAICTLIQQLSTAPARVLSSVCSVQAQQLPTEVPVLLLC